MPCFDIFNLLYSHLTPRPNHKCPSTLLKVFSTLREWWSARRNCLLRPPGFRKAVFYQCADLGNVSNTPSTKRRAAAKWKLQYEWQIKQCQLDSTGDIQPTCSAYKKKVKSLGSQDFKCGQGMSIRETLIENRFKSWKCLKLCIFRKSDAWLLKKIGTPWAVFFFPFMIKICASFQSLIDIWVGKFAFDSMCWYCHLEIRMVLIYVE